MRLTSQALLAAAVVGTGVAASSAFTAANTGTPLVSVGQSASVTTGFVVSDVDYALDTVAATGDRVKTISFNLAPAVGANPASEAKVRVVTGQDYYTCTGTAPAFSCTLGTGVAASTINTLDIVAVSN